MVSILQDINARVWEREMQWLENVIVTRLSLYFEQESNYASVFEVTPPLHIETGAPYVKFIHANKMGMEERIAFALSMAPHIKPSILDILFVKNNDNDRGYTVFGGLKGVAHGGFIPTGETLLFLLAGTDIKKRFECMALFHEDHFFSAQHILFLETAPNDEPALSGALKISTDIIAQFTTGHCSKPHFSKDFPAKLITTQLEWEDLVLPPHTFEQVDEIRNWVQYSGALMNEWGMDRKLKPGFKSLFYGPPGTGKTLTACLLGKQCGMDVYRVDLSMVISKYIGETEKNLSRIFDMAGNKNWILFFDEAEALFGKRTGVSDAHDRFANQEVSYLLQRIEDFPGVVILASNLKSNIDDAFTRRFQSITYFPVPEPEQRMKLWLSAFPDAAVREDKINLKQIAMKYELTGGTIMNVIRYSSLMSLKRSENIITLSDIEKGIKREYLKEGKIIA